MRLLRGLRWWELAPEAVVVLGLGLFAVTERSAASSAFGSTKALTLMGITVVAWVSARLLLLRVAPWPAARVAVFAVAGLAILKIVVFPAYQSSTVIEALPVSTVAPASSLSSGGPPAAPVAVRTGSIMGIKHRASGTASVYRQPDGSLTVGLESIDIQPGPDYDVFVVAGAGRASKSGGVRLDDLRGNVGTQYYDVPSDVRVDEGEWTVLVWCQTFDVPVAAATPS